MGTRKLIATYGRRGRDLVNVRRDDVREQYVVTYYPAGVPKRAYYSVTKEGREEAIAFAEGLHDGLRSAGSVRISIRELWRRYTGSQDYRQLRPATQVNYRARWSKWETFAGRSMPADDTSAETIDQFCSELRKLGIVPNQVGEHVSVAKVVYSWGYARRLLNRNDYGLYRFKLSKNERARSIKPAEYSREEAEAIIAALDRRSVKHWRAWAALMVIGYQGVRTRSALNLKWADVDLDLCRVHWRAEFDKTGEDWWQPLRWGAISALVTARWWREKLEHTRTDWVFFSERTRKKSVLFEKGVYRQSTLIYHLREAEARAGVPHLPYRGVHGLRKMTGGDVRAETADPKLAMEFLNDRDPKMIHDYLLLRAHRLEGAVAVMDELERERGG